MPTPAPDRADTIPRALGGWIALLGLIAARGYLVFLMALAAFAIMLLPFGFSGSVVHSGSMLPVIAVGDVVISQPLSADAPIPLGRVVTFETVSPSGEVVPILHRVVGVDADGLLVTAGDANRDVDSTPLDRADIVSQALLRVPFVGLPAHWLLSGQIAPFLLWLLITGGAITVEVLARGAERAGEPVPRHARRRTVPLLAGARLIAGGAAPVALVASLLLAPLGPVDGAFTGRSSSIGSSWTAAVLAPASQVVFTTNPSDSTGGIAMGIQPVVEIQDAAGNRVTGSRTVELTLTSPQGATLSCAATRVTGDSGRFSFSGCAVDKPGTYSLTATSSTLPSGISHSFVITTGPGSSLRFLTSPSTTQLRSPFGTQPIVAIVDAGGNRTTGTSAITLTLTNPGAAGLTCAANPRAAVDGGAAFSGCAIDTAGTFTLTASAAGLLPAVSAPFVITAAPRLTCNSQVWIATYSWSPTPFAPTVYHLYVNGIAVPATGADGWNSYVQLTSSNVPAALFPQGTATVEVRKVVTGGSEVVIGTGTVILGPGSYRTYHCG